MNIEKFVEKLNEIRFLKAFQKNNMLIIEAEAGEKKLTFFEPIEEIQKYFNIILSMKMTDSQEIYNDFYIEVSVKDQSAMHRERDLEISDTKNEIQYTIASPSKLYWILAVLDHENHNLNRWPIVRSRISRLSSEESPSTSIFSLLQYIFYTERTITVKTKEVHKIHELRKLITAFVFHLGYNFCIAYVPKNLVKNTESRFINMRSRISRDETIDAPKILPSEDLVFYYLSALSSTNPFNQFISFYHVIEHFFEIVVDEEAVKKLRLELIKPSFSLGNDRSLKDLVRVVKNIYKQKSESGSLVDERRALQLTLQKFCDIASLKDDVDEVNPSLGDYYSKHSVGFSGGATFNFVEDQSNYSSLANRIYSTRNSLIHSKESDKNNYKPFKNAELLNKEIPLMKAIAERIIKSSAKIIENDEL